MNSAIQSGLQALEKSDKKHYLHFDFPLTKKERERLVSEISSGNIIHHRYLPFISFEIRFQIYHAKEKSVVQKSRKITLPSHHDALTYRYYGKVLNHLYSDYAIAHCIDNVAVAYREPRPGIQLSNIITAKEVFDYTTSFSKSWIIKGDFHHFFDTLNHQHLAANLRKVFGDELPKDWSKMLQSITQYRSISRKTLERQLQVAHVKKAYRSDSSGTCAYTNNLQELGKLIKNQKVRLSGKNRIGIPQGTAVSAVLANVYMIDFDEWLTTRCEEFCGLYRRYSDDFILVLPQNRINKTSVKNLEAEIIQRSKVSQALEIEPTKTKLYLYEEDNHAVIQIPERDSSKIKSSKIDYLGFVFDGVSVSMRPKSIYKFIYRGRRKIGKYMSLGRSYDKLKLEFGESDIVRSAVVPKYATRSGSNKRVYRAPNLHQVLETLDRLQKIKQMKRETLYSIHKGVTIRYLSAEVRKPRSSMLGYALRAQQIFEAGNPKYHVVIRRQVLRQIKRNQRRIHQGREGYEHWKHVNVQVNQLM